MEFETITLAPIDHRPRRADAAHRRRARLAQRLSPPRARDAVAAGRRRDAALAGRRDKGDLTFNLPLVGRSKNAKHFSGGGTARGVCPPPEISSLRYEISTSPQGGGKMRKQCAKTTPSPRHRPPPDARQPRAREATCSAIPPSASSTSMCPPGMTAKVCRCSSISSASPQAGRRTPTGRTSPRTCPSASTG